MFKVDGTCNALWRHFPARREAKLLGVFFGLVFYLLWRHFPGRREAKPNHWSEARHSAEHLWRHFPARREAKQKPESFPSLHILFLWRHFPAGRESKLDLTLPIRIGFLTLDTLSRWRGIETQDTYHQVLHFLNFEYTFPLEGNRNYCRQRQNNLNQKRPKGLSRSKGMDLEVGGWELTISQEGLKAISLPHNSRLNANLHIFSGLKGLILSRALPFDVYNVISAIWLLFIA